MKKAAIYTPYLETVGGGEKYMMTIAEVLSKTFEVDVLLDKFLKSVNKQELKQKIERFHSLDLSKVNFIDAPLHTGDLIEKARFLKKYELLFYLSDGSIFHSTAKKSFLHFQMPLDSVQSGGLLNRFKLSSWRLAIYNSEFTKEYIEKKIKIKGRVIYPPVDIDRFKNKNIKRKNQILNVGRFMGEGTKKQHILIRAFIELYKDKKLAGWSLHLAGSVDKTDQGYLEELKKQAKGFPIIFHTNAHFTEITSLYQESKIFWHAMGYEESDPKKSEHFGISTVEALAAGVVPVVINKGGQKEIVTQGKTGILWDSLDSLKEMTLQLMSNTQLWNQMSKSGKNSVIKFSKENFTREIEDLIYE